MRPRRPSGGPRDGVPDNPLGLAIIALCSGLFLKKLRSPAMTPSPPSGLEESRLQEATPLPKARGAAKKKPGNLAGLSRAWTGMRRRASRAGAPLVGGLYFVSW